jgi:hypothetical protein
VIDPSDLAAHISAHGPWLYHATPAANVESILREGLKPGSEVGRSHSGSGFHKTRPGHVYLSTAEQLEPIRHEIGDATIRVDLRLLDPRRIDPDEDKVQGSFLPFEGTGEPWVTTEPPWFGPDWTAGPLCEGTLAHWAETTSDFDAPTTTAKSLGRGRIAYRGTVPPHALAAIAWPP